MPLAKRKLVRALAVGVGILLSGALFVFRSDELRAATLLLRFGNQEAHGLADVRAREVTESDLSFDDDRGVHVPGRLYLPKGVSREDLGGIVLSHGVHRLGIEEPRLKRFARSIASAGVAVYTEELRELADYRIDAESSRTISRAARVLAEHLGRTKVGVMGFSFAGGLSMLAAGDSALREPIAFVVSIGGYDDLERVLRFFVEDRIARPSGVVDTLAAHPYGPLVLVYGHAEDFFPAGDVVIAKASLLAWLAEDRDTARTKAKEASEPSRKKLEILFSEKVEPLRKEITASINRHLDLLDAVSPHRHLSSLEAKVFLLHGAGDRVIPASETLWLEKDGGDHVEAALVTRAVEHVELEGDPSRREKWELVAFMAQVLRAADREPRR